MREDAWPDEADVGVEEQQVVGVAVGGVEDEASEDLAVRVVASVDAEAGCFEGDTAATGEGLQAGQAVVARVVVVHDQLEWVVEVVGEQRTDREFGERGRVVVDQDRSC